MYLKRILLFPNFSVKICHALWYAKFSCPTRISAYNFTLSNVCRSCLRLAILWEPRVEGCLLIQLHLCLQKYIKMETIRTEPMNRNAFYLTNLVDHWQLCACCLVINFLMLDAVVLYVVWTMRMTMTWYFFHANILTTRSA